MKKSRSKLAAGWVKLQATDWILIVDDEPDIVSIFKQALMNKGFDVIGFTDPLLALEQFTHIMIQISDLPLIDIKMPYIAGFQLSERILEIDINVKICFMSAGEINRDALREIHPSISWVVLSKSQFQLII